MTLDRTMLTRAWDLLHQNVTTEDDFIEFVKYDARGLMTIKSSEVLAEYALPASLPTVEFATDGLNENATAVFVALLLLGSS